MVVRVLRGMFADHARCALQSESTSRHLPNVAGKVQMGFAQSVRGEGYRKGSEGFCPARPVAQCLVETEVRIFDSDLGPLCISIVRKQFGATPG